MRVFPTLLWLSLGAGILGCPTDDNYDDTRGRGDLGRGRFVYGCLGDGDTACATTDTPALPQAVAVGSLFDVRFAIDDTGPQPNVISPTSDLVRRTDAAFVVQSAGIFSLLAVNGNSEVIDLKHMRAADIAEVRVQRAKELPSRSVELARGQVFELSAQPFDAQGVRLAGALEYGWSSADENVLKVESLPDLHRVQVRGRSDGSTRLRVEVAGASFTVDVRVGSGEAEMDAGSILDAAQDDTDAAQEDAAEASADAALPDGASFSDDAGTDAGSIDGGAQ